MRDANDILNALTQKYAELNKLPGQEGNISWGSHEAYLAALLRLQQPITRILEIGFNAGHSCALFAETFPDAVITSIDVPREAARLEPARALINSWYPGRHTFILENSVTAVPKLEGTFDLILIDGSHDPFYPQMDLYNCRRVAHAGTVVLLDDAGASSDATGHELEPNKAWAELAARGLVEEQYRWVAPNNQYGFI